MKGVITTSLSEPSCCSLEYLAIALVLSAQVGDFLGAIERKRITFWTDMTAFVRRADS